MQKEFKVGDVVELRSGGPLMTVVATGDNQIRCCWFGTDPAGSHYPHATFDTFPSDALKEKP